MKIALAHKRTEDGRLDIDDPKPWRVDALAQPVSAATVAGKLRRSHGENGTKRGLRAMACTAADVFRETRDDPHSVAAARFDRRQHNAALDKAISALTTLVEAGPLHITLPKEWRETERDEYRNRRDDYVTACFFVDDLGERLEDLKKIRSAARGSVQGRPFTNDPALWSAAVSLYAAMFIFRTEGVKDKKLLMDIYVAAWMDAGLPEPHNAKNGETLRGWISKYLKRLNLGWK
ncbi:MAG TPA: hypothetical protein VGO06_16650 [Bosea sp. (in: a-proteobacteria)]|jgi:hypothetical protein|uniref:hypothetical protein n=1 Tax=Bosea sp. (in: a-proteobacteria) TaxID=1871050 RepID=UPI002E15FB4B|nr:hypothetical protein [Bosea sp. (in: a-proteobacteria)]